MTLESCDCIFLCNLAYLKNIYIGIGITDITCRIYTQIRCHGVSIVGRHTSLLSENNLASINAHDIHLSLNSELIPS